MLTTVQQRAHFYDYMSYNVYVANLFGSLEGGREASDTSDLGSSVELCLSSDLSDELGVRGRDLGILLPDTSGNCLLSTLVGRLPSLQFIKTWKMNTDSIVFENMCITVFDLILAGDTMQNLKLRVDFYYS